MLEAALPDISDDEFGNMRVFEDMPMETHQLERNTLSLMVDSGTFAQVCNPEFLPLFPVVAKGAGRGAIIASKTPLDCLGTKIAPGCFKARSDHYIKVHMEFKVFNVRSGLLSSMRLAKKSKVETRLLPDNMRLIFHHIGDIGHYLRNGRASLCGLLRCQQSAQQAIADVPVGAR